MIPSRGVKVANDTHFFDEDRRQYCELSLFPDDRPLPAGAIDAVCVRLDQVELRRLRAFGDGWLGVRNFLR